MITRSICRTMIRKSKRVDTYSLMVHGFFYAFVFWTPYSFGQSATELWTGTAFAITSTGHLATSAHVIDGAQELNVVNSDGVRVAAHVVAIDRSNDLAILKAEIRSKPLFLETAYQLRKGSDLCT